MTALEIRSFRQAQRLYGVNAQNALNARPEIVGRSIGSNKGKSVEVVHCYGGKYNLQPQNLYFNI